MPLGTTPALQIPTIAQGDTNKYLLVNTAIQALEDMLHAELAVDLTAGNHTLLESELTRYGIFRCSGHAVARDLVIPATVGSSPAVATKRIIFVVNDGTAAGTVTVKHPTGGTVNVAIGVRSIIYADGTDIHLLGDNAGGTLGSLSDVTLTTEAFGQHLIYNGAIWVNDYGNYLIINDQVGTTYTTVLTDSGKIVRLNNAANITVTVPDNATTAYSVGSRIYLRKVGAGNVIISPSGGVTINSPHDDLTLNVVGETVCLHKVATDEWDLIRDIYREYVSINDQAGTAYTVVLDDSFALVRLNNAASITLTVPTNATTAFPIGTRISIRQVGAGVVTIAGAGVTFNTPDDLVLGVAGEMAHLVKVATDTWDVEKDLTSAVPLMSINNQSGTTYTLVLSDAFTKVRCANASPFTLTVPNNATAAFSVGTEVYITQSGAGAVTVAAGGGVTLNSPNGLVLGTQWQSVKLTKVATDEWDVTRELPPVPFVIIAALTGNTDTVTNGAGKLTMRMPAAMTLTEVRASLTAANSSGGPITIDINEGGVSVLSTLLTIDDTEKTSTTAATPAVISDSALADDAEMTFDVDSGSNDATGLKVTLIGIYA